MALIKCNECAKEHSDVAVSCPHCGYSSKAEVQKVNSAGNRARKKKILFWLLSLIICLVIFGIALFIDNAIVSHNRGVYASAGPLATGTISRGMGFSIYCVISLTIGILGGFISALMVVIKIISYWINKN
ncbi:hypothetical protein Emin_1449 [Elusimicrobium minutum Pei191]|uniref:Zinc ribbon domain-containing protein n=1 Tax=Elusimicrobium minutum (strain Pei191) TaxID=445932 RepID=B2KEQ1_ELUMP|nr:zinc ribbon domain-containing protein [Elusimicrobium minutum]ACC98997.1 hypothetical protein Emin_1449 [Elusimicrobium minutum Pei191]